MKSFLPALAVLAAILAWDSGAALAQRTPVMRANNPFRPIVHVTPTAEDGKILLKIRNDFERSVTVEAIFFTVPGIAIPPILELIELAPAQTEYLDVTKRLSRLIRLRDFHGETLRLELKVHPLPERQPAEFPFRIAAGPVLFQPVPEEG